jgi:uncharacterized protein YjiK
MATIFFRLFFLTFFLSVTGQTENKNNNSLKGIQYNLSAPDKVYTLPAALREISGITEIDGSTIACIQDERGIIFIYDINKKEIIRQFVFGPDGDYEGVARVDRTLYVLRSDEVLTEVVNFNSDDFSGKIYEAAVPGKDIEGLCYDRKNNRLLIAPKEISQKNPENKGKRFIYGFDLSSKKMIKSPVLRFDIKSIKRFAVENNINIPMKGKKGKKQEPDIDMRISAIGINPLTDRLFALSGSERLLFVFDMNGNIEFLEKLDKDLFAQPEGITFMKNGDLFISNEGRNGVPTINRFNFKNQQPEKVR